MLEGKFTIISQLCVKSEASPLCDGLVMVREVLNAFSGCQPEHDLFSKHLHLQSDVIADLLCLDINCVYRFQPLKFLSFLCNDISQIFGCNYPFVPTHPFSGRAAQA